MKLILAIIQDQDAREANNALVAAGFHSTRLASTGGFLQAGSTTLLIGVEDEKVDAVCEVLKNACQTRTKITAMMPLADPDAVRNLTPYPVEVTVGGVVLFVLNIEQFIKE